MEKKRFLIGSLAGAVIGTVLTIGVSVWAIGTFTDFIMLKRTGSQTTMFMDNNTNGILDFQQNTTGARNPSSSSIGNLGMTGVRLTIPLPVVKDTLGDGWYPVAADSDNGIWLSQDFILDSISVFANWGAADSLMITTYKTNPNAQTISGPDTLFSTTLRVYKSIDYTGDADSLRSFDISAGKFPAFYFDEHGNVDSVFVLMHGRTYDVR